MIVKIDSNHDYILSENVNVARQHFQDLAKDVINVPAFFTPDIHVNVRNGIVFIFAHGDKHTVGGYDVDGLSRLFENPTGKTFVLISCEAGIGKNITKNFAESFAKKNHCRVLAPMGCSVFSANGVAVIPESEVSKYCKLQHTLEAEEHDAHVLNEMFDACLKDDKCFALKWDFLHSIDQLIGCGFMDIDAKL